jgi:hypothetical protein
VKEADTLLWIAAEGSIGVPASRPCNEADID